MNSPAQTLITTYLIYPLLGFVLGFFGILIAKKNALLGNKKMILYLITASLALTLPALLGLLNYSFMPWWYMISWLLYLILGWYNLTFIACILGSRYKYRHELFLTWLLTLAGILFYTPVFNVCNKLQYGFMAATCMLPFPFISLLLKTYRSYLSIPDSVYKIWLYNNSPDMDFHSRIDYGTLKVVTLEILKTGCDNRPIVLQVKVPNQIPFGIWMRRIIADYNKKSPLLPIIYSSNTEQCGWIFYIHNSIFLPKRYLDYSLTVEENHIKEHDMIIAKRIKEYKTE
ncbi:MAG: TssN family type VI secretion system protein [Bacteroidales bacterium]